VTRTTALGVVAACVLSVLSLSACQAGQSAQTSQDYTAVDGRGVNLPEDASFDDPYLAVRNAFVEDYGTSKSAVVTVVNNTDESDVLLSVAIGGQPATLSGGPLEFGAGESVTVGSGGETTAVADGVDAAPGAWTTMTVTFQNAGAAEIPVLVTALAAD
jgi:hypothetical protein